MKVVGYPLLLEDCSSVEVIVVHRSPETAGPKTFRVVETVYLLWKYRPPGRALESRASVLYKESEIAPATGPTLVSRLAPSRLPSVESESFYSSSSSRQLVAVLGRIALQGS
jgi:hypothetical protein